MLFSSGGQTLNRWKSSDLCVEGCFTDGGIDDINLNLPSNCNNCFVKTSLNSAFIFHPMLIAYHNVLEHYYCKDAIQLAWYCVQKQQLYNTLAHYIARESEKVSIFFLPNLMFDLRMWISHCEGSNCEAADTITFITNISINVRSHSPIPILLTSVFAPGSPSFLRVALLWPNLTMSCCALHYNTSQQCSMYVWETPSYVAILCQRLAIILWPKVTNSSTYNNMYSITVVRNPPAMIWQIGDKMVNRGLFQRFSQSQCGMISL